MPPVKRIEIEPFRGFTPLPTQRDFLVWEPPDPLVADLRLLSSGYGGGKSAVGCRESIRYALGYPHSRHLVSRFHYDDLEATTLVTYAEALDRIGLNDGEKPGMRHYILRRSPRPVITWWNGAVTMFRNLDDATGAKYGSFEINTAFIDEGSEVPDEVMEVLYPGRLRWHLPKCEFKPIVEAMILRGAPQEEILAVRCPCPKRMWACTNPGDSGFLLNVVKGGLDNSGWFPVPPGENIYAGPGYHEQMAKVWKARGDVKYARYILGSWDAFEGQRFGMLDRVAHFLPMDFMPRQGEYDIFEGHDFGFRNPHATVWIAVHKSREYPPIVVDYYQVPEREIPEHAKAIKERRALYGWNGADIVAVGDPAGNQTRGQTGLSDVMIFAQHGIEIIPMGRARDPGPRADLIALMLSRGVITRDGSMRGLMFCPRAKPVFESLLSYRFDEKRRTSRADAPEKFLKRDDHLVDATGYVVSAIPDPLERDGKTEHEEWNAEMAARRMPTVEDLDARIGSPTG